MIRAGIIVCGEVKLGVSCGEPVCDHMAEDDGEEEQEKNDRPRFRLEGGGDKA